MMSSAGWRPPVGKSSIKSFCLFVAAAGALIGGCAERPTGSALPEGPTQGLAKDIDPAIRYASPSGRYGRPSSAKAVESDAR